MIVSTPDWHIIDPLLGTMPDGQIAKQFGVGPALVFERRRLRGIVAHYKGRPKHDWSKIDGLLGTKSDAEIAANFGIPCATIQSRRRKLKINGFGGGKLGRPQLSVDKIRVIPSRRCARCARVYIPDRPNSHQRFCSQTCAQAVNRAKRGYKNASEIPWRKFLHLLGTGPDRSVAAHISQAIDSYVPTSAVNTRRRALGIPAYQPQRK